MSFESDGDLQLYPHVELGLRTESRGSSREAAAERSAGASRVLDDAPERLWAVACGRVSCTSSPEGP